MTGGVASLGYWGFEVSDRAAWRHFLVDLLGLSGAVRDPDGADVFRIDEYRSRIRLYEGPADDVAFIGWEVPGPAELVAIEDRLRAAGHQVARGDAALAKSRRVEELIVVQDPDDVRTEIFWGPEVAATPFASPLVTGGFVASEEGVGHHVLVVRDREKTLSFYRDLLGLRLSDYIRSDEPGRPALLVTFMHANTRHHSIAFAEIPFKPKRKMQHFAFQVASMSDVGLAYDRILAEETPIAMTLGHHPNCHSFSFYVRSPSGIDVEFAWGTRRIDDATWVPKTYSQLSDWGHKVGLDLIEPDSIPV